MVRVPGYINSLQPYKAGKPIGELAREKGLKRIVKLASNENPLGPSPRAMAAVKEAVTDLHRYVDPAATELIQAAAEYYGRGRDEIVAGHGTDSLLAYIINAFMDDGDELLTCDGTFIGIYVNTRKFGRSLRTIPLVDYTFDLDGLAEAIDGKTKIVYIANPNNPTGTMVTDTQFRAFMQKVPSDVLVILDEAYTIYARERHDYPDGVSYRYDNLIVTQTLSKAYGLGGIRVGFAIGPAALIEKIYRVKLPFEPNHLAQVAAHAALTDEEFVRRTIDMNSRSLATFQAAFRELRIFQVPTAANFILLILPTETFAADFFERCLDRGLIVRHVPAFGIPKGIRINSGTDEETSFAIDVIRDVYPALLEKHHVSPVTNPTKG